MSRRRRESIVVLIVSLLMVFSSATCRLINDDLEMFTFDVHHRFSDQVMKVLPPDELLEKGSLPYYANMVHRDLAVHGRRLTDSPAPLTFMAGNQTRLISSLGFLHYAKVNVGSQNLSFLVALDTGSNLFWLPCDCQECVGTLRTSSGMIDLNIYSPGDSTSSRLIPCGSELCYQQLPCNSSSSACPYLVEYLSDQTASFGYLVEDDLQLITDNTLERRVLAKVIVGCGKVQTGAFLEGGAPNGLFGLGLSDVSVPSTLAKQGLIANSFSLCFGSGATGRITFGDKGSANQSLTPINVDQRHASYNITVTKISVDGNASELKFHVIFDTGTSFAYLNDPAFSAITNMYNKVVSYPRFQEYSLDQLSFNYCYDIRPSKNASFPSLELTMKNGGVFKVGNPIAAVRVSSVLVVYCLGILKSDSIDIIGQNFMSGHRVVFDRERMVVGWEKSDCNNFVVTNSLSMLPAAPTESGLPPSSSSTGIQQIDLPTLNDSPFLFPATFLILKSLLLYIFIVS